MLVNVINLKKEIHHKIIFSKISFELNKGETLGVLGPNGSGKTIFIKTLLGIVLPTEGTIAIRPNTHIDYFLNNNLLFSELNVTQNIKAYSLLKNGYYNKERVSFLRDLIGLHSIKKRTVRKLSAGEKQRLSLLISLLNYDSSDLLILDEPLNYIDKEYQKAIMDFILKLPCAKVISTHHTELLENHFTKVLRFKTMQEMATIS